MKEARDSVPTQKMVQINWNRYNSDTRFVNLSGQEITEMNWDHAPPHLTTLNLYGNWITRMNWIDAPRKLTTVNLSGNAIREMNWDHTPPKLTTVYLDDNGLKHTNWKNVPDSLTTVASRFSAHGFQQEFKEYKAARRIQRAYLRHYTRRKVAARKIIEGCHAWVWKPICQDGTIGIRPRLDTRELGLE